MNFIRVAIISAIIGCSLFYLYHEKKRGETCVGCHYEKTVAGVVAIAILMQEDLIKE